MKVLSVCQPWAWLIIRPDLTGLEERARAAAAGQIKDLENRTQNSHHRGPLLIHSSAAMTRTEYADVERFLHSKPALRPVADAMPGYDEMRKQCGGIVGMVQMTGVVGGSNLTAKGSHWYMGHFGYLFKDSQPLPFTPMKGQLGIRNVPADVAHSLGVA